jgi:hypothetical protein
VTAQFAFDTLAFVKRLSAAGWDTGHAEALAEALSGDAFDRLASKSDLNELGVALRSDVKELGTALRSEIKELELRLTIRMGAMNAATIAILGAIITLS